MLLTRNKYCNLYTTSNNIKPGTRGTLYLVCALGPSPQSQAKQVIYARQLQARQPTHLYDVIWDS